MAWRLFASEISVLSLGSHQTDKRNKAREHALECGGQRALRGAASPRTLALPAVEHRSGKPLLQLQRQATHGA